MEVDSGNKWMESELGPLDRRSSVGTGSGARGSDMHENHDVAFFFSRFVFSLSIACHGSQTLFGLFGGPQMTRDPWMVIAGLFEFIGGLAIALGVVTRPIAFFLSIVLAVTYFKVNFPGSLWPIENHGEVTLLFFTFFLYLSVRGAGSVSIDGLRGKA